MRDSMNGAATFAVQGSGPAVAPLDHFEDGGGAVLESAWSHYQPHFPMACVKQEPVDHHEHEQDHEADPNNDSGISPGRCTGSGSSGSSSSSDGPSPERGNPRPSSNPVPVLTTSSPQQPSTPGRPESSPCLRVSVSLQSQEPLSAGEENSLLLQCVVCDFNTTNRSEFHAHVSSHYEPKGEGLSPDEDTDSEDAAAAGIRTPRVNSQGKVKTFRCKQCDFVALTKLEFWEHSRGHIKADKLLTCPKCPFVTEYKHHLEYHLRNHFGSKPFKCDKCSYSCVNKSMLNSHLKSHSNIYQYRCNDCSYATKYCHSLKLHLRKYAHKPAMVLNPDGSPNPLPIIDVYGTRRGPKLRPKNDEVDKQQLHLQHQQPPSQIPPSQIPQFPMFQAFNMLTKPATNGLQLPFPYAPLMNGAFPPNHSPVPAFPYSTQPPPPLPPSQQKEQENNVSVEHSLLAQQLVNNVGEQQQQQLQQLHHQQQQQQDGMMKDYLARVITSRQLQIPQFNNNNNHHQNNHHSSPSSQYLQEEVKTPTNPLDLSKPLGFDMSPNNNNNNSSSNNNNVNGGNNHATKNRRKGKAYKLERILIQRPEEMDEDEEEEPRQQATTPPQQHHESEDEEMTPQKAAPAGDGSECYSCSYCDITFKDVVMYTMHMGYHGFQDPFKCNMCGQQTADRVTFFLHIARSSHC